MEISLLRKPPLLLSAEAEPLILKRSQEGQVVSLQMPRLLTHTMKKVGKDVSGLLPISRLPLDLANRQLLTSGPQAALFVFSQLFFSHPLSRQGEEEPCEAQQPQYGVD